jgi:hypothetical protein
MTFLVVFQCSCYAHFVLVGYAICALVGILVWVVVARCWVFFFLHFSYVVVVLGLPSCVVIGAWCGLLLLFLSHYSFRTIFIHWCSSHFHSSFGCSSHCCSSCATTLLMLPLFLHRSSCLATPFVLLFLHYCCSCISGDC